MAPFFRWFEDPSVMISDAEGFCPSVASTPSTVLLKSLLTPLRHPQPPRTVALVEMKEDVSSTRRTSPSIVVLLVEMKEEARRLITLLEQRPHPSGIWHPSSCSHYWSVPSYKTPFRAMQPCPRRAIPDSWCDVHGNQHQPPRLMYTGYVPDLALL